MPSPPFAIRHQLHLLGQSRHTAHTTVRVWSGANGQADRRVFEKVHADPARLKREWTALTGWAKDLGQSPELLAAENNTLWLAEVPGRSAPVSAEAWAAAGRWLARAHALPPASTDPLPIETALARRWRGLLRRARPLVKPRVLAACTEYVADPAHLATPRVCCHRDFTPDNWVWHAPSQRLYVLDFEHARPDVAWSDLAKLYASDFYQNDVARTAFESGYGTIPSPSHRAAWVAWHGLATLTWGLRQREEAFIQLGRAALQTLQITDE